MPSHLLLAIDFSATNTNRAWAILIIRTQKEIDGGLKS